MASELIAGLGLFKTMLDIAKGLKDMNETAARNTAVIELQEHILNAKEAQSTLLDEVSSLKKQMADMEKWDAEKQRYELKEVVAGQFAYTLKHEAAADEPAHKLCANCYNQNQKSILQTEIRNPGRHEVLFCQRCGTDLFSPHSGGRDAPNVTHSGGTWGRSRRRE